MAKRKIKIGVVFGGRSGEHEVSVVSAESVMKALDKSKYEVIPIGITKAGKWITGPKTVRILKDGTKNKLPLLEKIVIPDATKRELVPVKKNRLVNELTKNNKIDVIIPILHGPLGEDGTIQGLFELANLPYVGAGVLGSAIGMDKVIQKKLFKEAQLPVVKFISFIKKDWLKNKKKITDQIKRELGFPCFTKSANLGSSVGISKIHSFLELEKGIAEALKYDRKVIVEKAVVKAREIEIGILGNDEPKVSVPGEIIPSREFYDYDAKYVDEASKTVIPAKLPKAIIKKAQNIALKAFQVIDGAGMARVDFLVGKKNNKIYLSEINTIPGFTSISMYTKLWEASGIPYPKLIEKLINLAQERHKEKNQLLTSYKPKENWYRK
ncbi:MAG: hypothetical protein ACD_12C00464G0003 [uncultured bacterium]|nr:MAG: hypothetical protein ACD_12C00464G0003 [uncultured bacterium]